LTHRLWDGDVAFGRLEIEQCVGLALAITFARLVDREEPLADDLTPAIFDAAF
jgi:hypothetical protein